MVTVEKEPKKLLNITYRIGCFLFPLIVSYFIIKYNKGMEKVAILSDEFMINFLGIVLGLGIAIIALVFAYVDKIRVEVSRLKGITTEPITIESNISRLLKSLKEDILSILLFFVAVFALSMYKGFDIPYLKWQFNILSKNEFILMLKLYLAMLTLISIVDVTSSLFGLLQISEELLNGINRLTEKINIRKRWF